MATSILEMIQNGELSLGSSFPNEADLCTRFQASRTRVREAVKYLQGKGFLRVEHGRGTWIEPVEHWDLMDKELWTTALTVGDRDALIQDLVETRCMLETRIVELAARNRSSAHLRDLQQDINTMEAALTVCDTTAFNNASRRFHDHLAIAAGNVILLKLSRSLHEALEITKQSSKSNIDVLRLSLMGHQAILKAVVDGIPEEASKAMLKHLADFEESVREASDQITSI
ncbi:MAG: FadR family transcriptional regulator [Nitrososphaerota archaeon]|nr:FadR family transcriptional regulator [Nitrososphaerota archaeon]